MSFLSKKYYWLRSRVIELIEAMKDYEFKDFLFLETIRIVWFEFYDSSKVISTIKLSNFWYISKNAWNRLDGYSKVIQDPFSQQIVIVTFLIEQITAKKSTLGINLYFGK